MLALKADLDGGLLEQAIEAHKHEQPGVPIDVTLCGWGEQARLLREGRADVALVYQPHERLDEHEVDFDIVLEEPQFVALPAAHPLASFRALRLAELEADHERTPGTVIWRPRRADRSAQDSPRIGDMSRLLKLVELGQLIALLPASVAARRGGAWSHRLTAGGAAPDGRRVGAWYSAPGRDARAVPRRTCATSRARRAGARASRRPRSR